MKARMDFRKASPAADKAMIYTLAVIGCMIVIGIVVSFILGAVARIF